MRVSSDMPDDVIVLHDAFEALRVHKKGEPQTINLKNCGTALRFLEAHLEQCYPGEPIRLTGDARLMERKGKPTSQTKSALLMHGIDVPYKENESPYITMTRKLMANGQWRIAKIERDWSAAAFWYEYVAIHGGELLLEGLTDKSIQGDRVVADIYEKYFGVTTEFVPEGAVIKGERISGLEGERVSLDFTNCPDLYPAVALTCEKLGMELVAKGTERLKYKESDRLEAVRLHEVRDDHRMAMALMCADFAVSEKDQVCISKSYPEFISSFSNASRSHRERHRRVSIAHVTPIRGVNDEGKGKKFALSKLIHAAEAEYVWMHDDDVVLPEAAKEPNLTFPEGKENLDLIILPLCMESALSLEGRGGEGLLERLQIAEYAAIQELTMRSAKKDQAVMCSGANLIVRREVWLECESELHPEIPSGDDMFLLEAVKRRGYKIGVIDEEDYTAVVRPQTSWKAFFRQRMRWAGKAPKYTDKDIIRCGALVAAANILQILCPLIILIKFPIEYSLIRSREPRTPWYVALLLEILYPIYLLISLIGGMINKKEW